MPDSAGLRTMLPRAAAMVLLTAVLLLTAMSAVGATESHGTPPGPEPREANATDNEFRPLDYEQNFLWGAAVGLGALTVGGAGALAGLYWLLVQRPARQAEATKNG